jgi:hypothetical protein
MGSQANTTPLVCADAQRIARAWVQELRLAADDADGMRRHCATCASCARRFEALLPFFARDAGGTAVSPREDPSPDFVNRVMAQVKRAPDARQRVRRIRLAAIAAGLIVFAGVSVLMLRIGAARAAGETLVRFELVAPGAKSVSLVGSFSGWQESGLALSDRNGDGIWEIAIRLRRDSLYTYNFLIDGKEWVSDPAAAAQVDDGFGGTNSVLSL